MTNRHTPRAAAATRPPWLVELAALAAAVAVTIVVFATTSLDLAFARFFYDPAGGNPWPLAEGLPWSLLYRSAPFITGLLAVVGAAAIIAGALIRRLRRWRRYGAFIILAVAIGPGLLVNTFFKDHWGRPRPREVVQLSGQHPYVRPLVPSDEGGKSFPCGHCSVGFLYALGWWIWRRRRPRLAVSSLAFGLVLGTLLGLGRVAAGAHFLSDVVWSGLIAFGVAHVLCYHVLRLPQWERTALEMVPNTRRRRLLESAAAVLAGLGIILGGLLATPHTLTLHERVSLARFPQRPRVLELVADTLDLELDLAPRGEPVIRLEGRMHGFGLPTSRIRSGWSFAARPVPTAVFRITPHGRFTDLDGSARLEVPTDMFPEIVVRIRRGDITVTGAPHGAATSSLDNRTEHGRVVYRQAVP